MATLVRRRHSRISLPIVAYMEIEPGNGAIVLDVSHGGLCFQAVSPLEPGAPVHFAFKEQNRRMIGSGELVWLDDRGKSGGIRFTDLSPEARAQLDRWLVNARSHDVAERVESRLDKEPRNTEEHETHSNAQVAALRLSAVRPLLPAPLKVTIRRGGLYTALSTVLCGSILGSIFLLGYARHRDLGDRLAFMGERWGTVADRNGAEVVPTKEPPSSVAASAPATASATPPDTDQKSGHDNQKPDEAESESEPEVVVRHFTTPDVQPTRRAQSEITHAQDSVPPAPPSLAAVPDPRQLALAVAPPTFSGNPSSAFPKLELREEPARGLESAAGSAVDDSTVHMYLDLGRFKDELAARDVRDRVSALGQHATVLKSKSLWKTSYQVLVGPYGDQDEQTSVQFDLKSRGYKARPFERGSRGFMFRSTLNLNGSQLPTGDSYTISWESYVENANVRFTDDRGVIARASGRWVERGEKYPQDEYVYSTKGANKILLEIHFAGLKRALVFGGSS